MQPVDDNSSGTQDCAEEEKRKAVVMVYLTTEERVQFKAWAFNRGRSMSEILRHHVVAHSSPQPAQGLSELPPPSSQEHPDEAGQDLPGRTLDSDVTAALANMLWRALEGGSPLPDLADEVGLPAAQIRQVLTSHPIALPLAQ